MSDPFESRVIFYGSLLPAQDIAAICSKLSNILKGISNCLKLRTVMCLSYISFKINHFL